MDDWSLPEPRLALLLEHFAAIEDVREPWRVAYPLREALFLASAPRSPIATTTKTSSTGAGRT
jgi:hypothetical protein